MKAGKKHGLGRTIRLLGIDIWILPQNLLGLSLAWLLGNRKTFVEHFNECRVYAVGAKSFSGVSLGRHIFLNRDHLQDKTKYQQAVRHEYGHFRQGLIFGFLYLPVIGIPSALNNLRARKNRKVFNSYYQRYPEKWADRLGGVRR